MKLSQYAKQQGISYRTALRWFRAGAIAGYQAPSGTIIVQEDKPLSVAVPKVAIYARVSSAEHRANLDRQAERLVAYASARGYQVERIVKEIGSGVNDNRPKFLALLTDPSIGRSKEKQIESQFRKAPTRSHQILDEQQGNSLPPAS